MRSTFTDRDTPNLRWPILCCLLAVVVLSLTTPAELRLRSAVRDLARPGFAVRRWIDETSSRLNLRQWPWTPSPGLPTEALAARHTAASSADYEMTLELRRLRGELAIARHQFAQLERSMGPLTDVTATASTRVQRIAGRLLLPADDTTAPGGLVLAGGATAGIAAHQPVIEAVGGTFTAGSAHGVSSGAEVLAGAAVIGRTDQVGAWTSTVVPLTDTRFRAHVFIVRNTPNGPVFGEEGVLQGNGHGGCVVKYLPSTAAVAVGDHVYSHDRTGRLPQPLYYGQIERAVLNNAAPHWEVTVQPAADLTTTTVQVLVAPEVRVADAGT